VPHPGLALAEDHLARREPLDLDSRGEPLQGALVELRERLVVAQELRDVLHRDESPPAQARDATRRRARSHVVALACDIVHRP
jgi:hypothetical protein